MRCALSSSANHSPSASSSGSALQPPRATGSAPQPPRATGSAMAPKQANKGPGEGSGAWHWQPQHRSRSNNKHNNTGDHSSGDGEASHAWSSRSSVSSRSGVLDMMRAAIMIAAAGRAAAVAGVASPPLPLATACCALSPPQRPPPTLFLLYCLLPAACYLLPAACCRSCSCHWGLPSVDLPLGPSFCGTPCGARKYEKDVLKRGPAAEAFCGTELHAGPRNGQELKGARGVPKMKWIGYVHTLLLGPSAGLLSRARKCLRGGAEMRWVRYTNPFPFIDISILYPFHERKNFEITSPCNYGFQQSGASLCHSFRGIRPHRCEAVPLLRDSVTPPPRVAT